MLTAADRLIVVEAGRLVIDSTVASVDTDQLARALGVSAL